MGAKKRVAIAAALLAAAATGILLWRTFRSTGHPTELVLHGNVDIREVQLAFNARQRITKMLVQEGDTVVQGQLLATLDTSQLVQAVARAEAEVQAQQQVVAKLQAGSRPEEIRKARADVQAARVQARNAELDYARTDALVDAGATTTQSADNSRTAAEAALAERRAAEAALALVLAGPRKEDIAAAKASLEASKANLLLLQTQLGEASLYAPVDGIVRNRILEPGDMASPERPVYTLALTHPVWVRVYAAERDLGKIRPGMPASVTTDSFPGKQYAGYVGYISPTAEFTPKSVETREVRTTLVYQIRVFVPNPSGELRLGMPATALLALSPAASASGHANAQDPP